ncbi:hypothetical protein SLE2022_062220 [Rubroshorea leprosula]
MKECHSSWETPPSGIDYRTASPSSASLLLPHHLNINGRCRYYPISPRPIPNNYPNLEQFRNQHSVSRLIGVNRPRPNRNSHGDTLQAGTPAAVAHKPAGCRMS